MAKKSRQAPPGDARPASWFERANIEGLERRSGRRVRDGEALEWVWARGGSLRRHNER